MSDAENAREKSDDRDARPHWSVDRRIPLALIVTFGVSTGSVLWQGGKMQALIDGMSTRLTAVETTSREQAERDRAMAREQQERDRLVREAIANRDRAMVDLIAQRERESAQREGTVREAVAELRATVESLRDAVRELRSVQNNGRRSESGATPPPPFPM